MRSVLKLLVVAGCLSAIAAAWAQDDQAPGQAMVVPAAGARVAPSAVTKQPPTLQNIYGRTHLLLDGRWNYIVDPYEAGYYNYRHQPFDQSATGSGGFYDDRKPKDKTESVEYSFDGSPTLAIPGDWNSQNAKLENYEGTVWMRQQFQAAPKDGKHYFLYFGAVNYEAHVYLNGKKVGSHKGGFTPFQFEVTGRLLKGQNTVIVKADNTRHQDDIPTLNTDWWNYGGITRDVLLAETPDTYIADYQIQLAKGDMGRIEGYVQMTGAQRSQDVTITIPEAGVKTTVHTGADGRAAVSIPLAKSRMRYWSPEDPKLYTVTIAGATDQLNDRIGFRTIETRGQDLLLNGKSVFLRGISLHDENPLIPGRLRGEGDMRMMLQWAKEMNCNYVRLAHYPHSEEMIKLADEMGILVWAEVPVYWTISWEKPEVYANASQQLTDLVTRDRNRASVIIWSIGNETPVSDARNVFMGKLADTVRSLDHTRLVAAALEVHRKGNEVTVEDPLADKIDLASFNEYAGWYWSDNKEMLKFSFKVNYNKPVIITEFGADALGGLHADDDTRWSEEYQDLLYKNQFKLLDAIPGLRGMTPWVLTDFRSPRRPHPYYQDFWNRKGLVSETGKKKLAFYTMKAYYDQKQQQYK
ncbi:MULTISPECIES: glycoside hydrolase family 2 protein [unclassified Duganella]|uniref:glycoside hydrolase family 2 protein n=1 Tax=unclassified Duganella TaxID=2636909 RepID=UPI000E34CF15|nr:MULTISPECIES: glycoside hydrolase family 2 TIM barrel-domain containing protein [unclassified Duganella]RFP11335.1 beta-glucuronidase [Duganella sp. BJB475]RFP29654.1 beta-glucuronidase [Duganella sp. BJB476]